MKTPVIQSKQTFADTETPVSAYRKLCADKPYSFLLESVENKDVVGRYSIVAFDPMASFLLEKDELTISFNGDRETHPASDFFVQIRQFLNSIECEAIPDIPCVGSLMGFVGYDAVRLIERLPPMKDGRELPIANLAFPSRFVIFDHFKRMMTIVAVAEDDVACGEKIREIEQALESTLTWSGGVKTVNVIPPDKERYMENVRKSKEYIRAGDIFQVVVSDRFRGESDIDPMEVYRRIRVRSPSPYMFYLDFGDYRIVGASPETLVKVVDRKVTILPIAGTRGRSSDPEQDKALERELLASEKETAEHIMLVDLARNDAGRVCSYGTVTVNPYMTVERYSHVMHIVSQVTGSLRDNADAVGAFLASFPAGTLSGAPKIRAMEIIDELENFPRGPYGGAVGYFGLNDEMDTCIAIRMILFKEDRFTVNVGAGIVADSVPEMEYEELEHKAAQSIAALRSAARREL